MTTRQPSRSRRAWLRRVALSLLVALLAGALAFLIARGVTSVLLFVQQQQFLSEVAGALQGGIEGLPNGNLREIRKRVQELDARNERLSLVIGFVAAGVAVAVAYLWLERRATDALLPERDAEKET